MALDQVYADLENEGYSVQSLIIPACAVDAPHRRDRCAIVAWNSNSRDRDAWAEREVEKRENAEPTGICENVAHAESIGLQREWSGGDKIGGTRPEKAQPERRCDVLSNTDNRGRSLWRDGELPAVEETATSWADHRGRAAEYVAGEWWPAEPDVGRVAHGVPHRVDRLRCLGNAVVPQQFYSIFRAIKETEEMLCDTCN